MSTQQSETSETKPTDEQQNSKPESKEKDKNSNEGSGNEHTSLFSDEFTNQSNQDAQPSKEEQSQSKSKPNWRVSNTAANTFANIFSDGQTPTFEEKYKPQEELIHSKEPDITDFSITVPYEIIDYIARTATNFVGELNIAIGETGVLCAGVDSRNTCLYKFWIDNDDINIHSFTKGVIGINPSALKSKLIGLGSEEKVKLDTIKTDDEWGVKLITPDQTETCPVYHGEAARRPSEIPTIKTPASIQLPLDEYYKVLGTINQFTNHAILQTDGNQVIIGGEGDTDTICVRYETAEDLLYSDKNDSNLNVSTPKTDIHNNEEMMPPDECASLFSLKFLYKYAKGLRKSQRGYTMNIQFGMEFPCIGTIAVTDKSYNKILVAPRLSQNNLPDFRRSK